MKFAISKKTLAILLAGSMAVTMTAPAAVLAAERMSGQVKEQSASAKSRQVNINTAEAETIADVLVGIGASKAKAIIKYREEHGRFTAIDQLRNVRGIGQSLIDNNRQRITLE